MFDLEFFKKVEAIRDPLMGTEIMAPMLYYLIRSVRPARVLEYGMGYSTFFILKALADNIKEFQHEKEQLLNKNSDYPTPISQEDFDKWLFDNNPPLLDPAFYKKVYAPQLICFEKLPKTHDYSSKILNSIKELNLDHLLTFIHGDACTDIKKIPQHLFPLDFIWCDDGFHYKFFKIYWNLMNDNDSYLLFHSTVNTSITRKAAMDKIKAALSNKKNYQLIDVIEPHKLHQRSFTILHKFNNKDEVHFDLPEHQEKIYNKFLNLKMNIKCN